MNNFVVKHKRFIAFVLAFFVTLTLGLSIVGISANALSEPMYVESNGVRFRIVNDLSTLDKAEPIFYNGKYYRSVINISTEKASLNYSTRKVDFISTSGFILEEKEISYAQVTEDIIITDFDSNIQVYKLDCHLVDGSVVNKTIIVPNGTNVDCLRSRVFHIGFSTCPINDIDGKSMLPIDKNSFTVTMEENRTTGCYDFKIVSDVEEPYRVACFVEKFADGSDCFYPYHHMWNEQTTKHNKFKVTKAEFSDSLKYGSTPDWYNGSAAEFQEAFKFAWADLIRLWCIKMGIILPEDKGFDYSNDEHFPDLKFKASLAALFVKCSGTAFDATKYFNSWKSSPANTDFQNFYVYIGGNKEAYFYDKSFEFTGNYSWSIPFDYLRTSSVHDYIFTVEIFKTDVGGTTGLEKKEDYLYDFPFTGNDTVITTCPWIDDEGADDYSKIPRDSQGNPIGEPINDTIPNADDPDSAYPEIFDKDKNGGVEGPNISGNGSFTDVTNGAFNWIKGFLDVFPNEVKTMITVSFVIILAIGLIRLVVG